MKKILLFLGVFLIATSMVTALTVQSEDPENPEIEQYTEVDTDKIVLRDALELEKAAMQYVLAYEAYVEAKNSKDPETRGKTVELMKDYRKAYASFLAILREDNLYHPQKPKNPAGWFNKKHKEVKGEKREWKKTAMTEVRKMVKDMVKKGKSPKEIKDFISKKMPSTPMSRTPSEYQRIYNNGSDDSFDTNDDNGGRIDDGSDHRAHPDHRRHH
ncbi:MAG: hypothetical protein AB1403_13060 [Candidatus Riflebacteria bacterium]